MAPVRSTRPDGRLTVAQVAQLAGVKPITVYQWMRRGYWTRDHTARVKLPFIRAGRLILIDPVDAAKAEHHTAVRARRVIEPTAASAA